MNRGVFVKKMYFIFIFLFLFFVSSENVFAIYEDYFNVECYYNDGKSIVKSYDNIAGTVYAGIEDAPVRNSKKIEYDVNGYKLLGLASTCSQIDDDCITNGYNIAIANKLNSSCPSTFNRWLVKEWNESMQQMNLNLVYFYDTEVDGNNTENKPDEDYDVYHFLKYNNKYGFLGLFPSQTNTEVLDADPTDGTLVQKINLVSERVTVNHGIDPKASCTFVYNSKQASGTNQYITISRYGTGDGLYDMFLIDDGESATSISRTTYIGSTQSGHSQLSNVVRSTAPYNCESFAKKVCVKLSERQSQGSQNEFSYTSIRHEIRPYYYNKGGCDDGFVEYVYSNSGVNGGSGDSENLNQICDSIPKTAFVLSEVLSYIQILVPVLVMVYTGIDIAKIVLAGNLDEELPKKKKSIIIRGIVMVVFFFIPLIIKVILGNLYGTDIGAIDCITKVTNDANNKNDNIQNSDEEDSIDE